GTAPRDLVGRARRDARRALRIADRMPLDRTEIYRLAGRLEWLLRKHERALHWWGRSIGAGRRLGARPGRARTYLEVGQRLRTTAAHTLDGLPGAAYLEQARALLTELNLERDLGQAAA